jgi:hypothetical protein
MENSGLSKYTTSFGLSLALASVANGLLVIAKESSPAVQAGMQKITGHHWITHSVVILALFFGCGLLFAQANGGQGIKLTADRLINTVVRGVVLGALLIVGFYILGD